MGDEKRTAKHVSYYECDCEGRGKLKFVEATKVWIDCDMYSREPSEWTRYFVCPECGAIFMERWRGDDTEELKHCPQYTEEYVRKNAPRTSGWGCL